MKTIRLAFITGTLLVALTSHQATADCTVTESRGSLTLLDPGTSWQYPETPLITLENPRIIARIAPEANGNIAGFTDKTRPDNPFHRLDDKFESSGQWKPGPFAYRIDERGPHRVAVTLTGGGTLTPDATPGNPQPVGTELALTRTMAIDGTSSCLRVEVSLTNRGSATIPSLRYMVHSLYSYKVLPGATVYAFFPSETGIQLCDHEAIVKNNYLATLAPASHPFKRWSRPGDHLVKARYPARGWAAMFSDSGSSYLFYDPAQFDFISFWSGTHPAEWLVMEPNTKAVDLKPGQTTTFAYTLASDARDVPFRGQTLVVDQPQVPEEATPGRELPLGVRLTTVRDQSESVRLVFRLLQNKRQSVLTQTLSGVAKPFLYSDLAATAPLPANLRPGVYDWRMEAGDGAALGAGQLEILSAANAAKRQAARMLPPPALWTNSAGMVFVRIPAGSVLMGSAAKDPQAQPDELPQHQVRISHAFLMAKYEVTNAQFRKFRPGYHNELDRYHNRLPGAVDADNQPARTTHNTIDAEAFLTWLNANDPAKPAGWNYRLPTEAEWEYAARGPFNRRYPWGNVWDSTRCEFGDQHLAAANRPPPTSGADLPRLELLSVGSFSPRGDSSFGVCDMAGGLWEWCRDSYDPDFYRHSPKEDPVNLTIAQERDNLHGEGSETVKHVLRGGSWASLPTACRSAFRYAPCSTHNPTIGIRVVLAPADRSR